MMHELGHNLNLLHGGNVNTNCKPNYLSVMNYLFELPTTVPSRPLDFSRSTLYTLLENNLNEPVGIKTSTPLGLTSAFGPSPAWLTNPLNKPTSPYYNPVDWNRNGQPVNTGVTANINNIGISDCNFAALPVKLFMDLQIGQCWDFGVLVAPLQIALTCPMLLSSTNATGISNYTGTSNNTDTIYDTGMNLMATNVTNIGPKCDVQDPECTPKIIGLCDADSETCVSTPCNINDKNCALSPCDLDSNKCFKHRPPCIPANDLLCPVNRDLSRPDFTINDVRGLRVTEVTQINNIIQKLSDSNFVGPGTPSEIKSSFRDKLVASSDSALVSVAANRLDITILKLNEVKTEITAHIQPADTQNMLYAKIDNLSQALRPTKII